MLFYYSLVKIEIGKFYDPILQLYLRRSALKGVLHFAEKNRNKVSKVLRYNKNSVEVPDARSDSGLT